MVRDIQEKIKKKKIKIGVIGLGYVGLPIAVNFAQKGFKVLGFDIKKDRVDLINKGISYIGDVENNEISDLVKRELLKATVDYDKLSECDAILICVPTPVNINKEPDNSYIIITANEIAKYLRKGQIIILKSTVAPETTEKIVLPILEKTKLKVGKDFFLAFSPERIDPGNKKYNFKNIPTIIGGITEKCTKIAYELYKCVINKVYTVSSAKVAEMTKLLENTFRNVNIALVNELLQLCERMGIDIWEVIEAAKTKPFGFMPFYPGPGVGGHCIPIDPYYLSWKAREYDFHVSFIELAAKINESMPYYVANKVTELLSKKGICPSKATVLILGITFKKDIPDIRNSPVFKIIEILQNKVYKVMFNDPYVKNIEINKQKFNSVPINNKTLKNADCVVIATDHTIYPYEKIIKNSKLIFDTRNATKNISQATGTKGGNIVKIGC